MQGEADVRGERIKDLLAAGCLLLVAGWAGSGWSEPGEDSSGGSGGAPESLTSNPLEFNLSTIKRGKQLYTVHCVRCHGVDGRGDTEMREFLKTAPADLTDDAWIYGNADVVIFSVIRDGRTARDMPAFRTELTDERIWQVVSYMEYLGGRRP